MVELFHFIDGVMLTSASLTARTSSTGAVAAPEIIWLCVNATKFQGPGLFVKFLGVGCLGKMKAYLRPTTIKELQSCGPFGILESVYAPPSTANMAIVWPDQEWGSWDWDKTV